MRSWAGAATLTFSGAEDEFCFGGRGASAPALPQTPPGTGTDTALPVSSQDKTCHSRARRSGLWPEMHQGCSAYWGHGGVRAGRPAETVLGGNRGPSGFLVSLHRSWALAPCFPCFLAPCFPELKTAGPSPRVPSPPPGFPHPQARWPAHLSSLPCPILTSSLLPHLRPPSH